MKNNKGFTLVELLAVIVLISLVMIIAFPLIQTISRRSKENILESKVTTATNALLMWSQENEKCFIDNTGRDCIVEINRNTCEKTGDLLKCHTTMGELAAHNLITYDKVQEITIVDPDTNETTIVQEKTVVDPTTNGNMNDYPIYVYYNTHKKIFTINTSVTTHTTKTPITQPTTEPQTTTAPIFSESNKPVITFNPTTETNYTKSKTITVIVQDVDSGLKSGGSFNYAWSTNGSSVPSTTEGPILLTYSNGIRQKVETNLTNNTLTGIYYLWIDPTIEDLNNNAATTTRSQGPYYFDNTPPNDIHMNFVFSNYTPYATGSWTNQDLYAARNSIDYQPSGGQDDHVGFDKFQISLDNTNWTDYSFNRQNDIYHMYNEGIHHRYFRACDKLGNCTNGLDIEGKIDRTAPTITNIGGSTTTISFTLGDSRSGVESYCLTDIENPNSCNWVNITPTNYKDITATNLHPGKILYIYAKDLAGNISNSQTLNSTCEDVTYIDGDECSKACDSGTLNRLAFDSHTGVACPSKNLPSGGATCNAMTCCSSTEIDPNNCDPVYTETCSKPCDGGVLTRTRTCGLRSAYDHSTICSGRQTETTTGGTCNEKPCNITIYFCAQPDTNIHETVNDINCTSTITQCYTYSNAYRKSVKVKNELITGTQIYGGEYLRYYELVNPIEFTLNFGYGPTTYTAKYVAEKCMSTTYPTSNCNSVCRG